MSVRLFIVQERYNGGEWRDDPDQPDDYTHGFDQAKWWMEILLGFKREEVLFQQRGNVCFHPVR